MTPWWAGTPPVDAAMPCGSGHVGRWGEGELEVADLDTEAEQVLAALGGTACRCADLVRWWAALAEELDVLALGPRSAADQPAMPPEQLRAKEAERRASLDAWRSHRRRLASAGAGGPAGSEDEHEASSDEVAAAWEQRVGLLWVLTLPPALQRRLVATVAHHAVTSWEGMSPIDRARVAAAVVGRAGPVIRSVLVRSGLVDEDGSCIVDLRIGGPNTPPELTAELVDGEARVAGVLGVDWLAGVWGREVAEVPTGFVLDVTEVTAERVVRGRSVRWRRSDGNTRVEAVVEEWENGDPPSGEPTHQE